MKLNSHISRRKFLGASGTGVAGIMAAGMLPSTAKAAGTRNAWVDGMQVNPNIDNLRMVLIKDTTQPIWNNQQKVFDDLDQGAKVLAQKTTATEAWSTIFRKPVDKQWTDVKVALKATLVHPNVLTKIVDVLHGFGVPFTNFYTWTGDQETNPYWSTASIANYTGVNNVKGIDMGGYKRIPVSITASNGAGTVAVKQIDTFGYLADNFFDIMVNFASDRMHPEDIGHATLCMKNHYGSFNHTGDFTRWGVLHQGGSMYYAMLDLNKLYLFYGGTPVRQQLCIIHTAGLGGAEYIGMGTFAPALDYTYIKKIRIALGEDTLANAKQTTLDAFATFYGYTPAQFAALDFIDWQSPISPVAASLAHTYRSEKITMSIANPRFKPVSVNIDMPVNSARYVSASIFDQRGRLVRELTNSNTGAMAIVWDGLSSSGRQVPTGSYIVKVTCDGNQSAGSLTLMAR